MGRPPTVGNGETVMVTVRLTPEQNKAVRRAAKKRKQTKSHWMRAVLIEAVKAILGIDLTKRVFPVYGSLNKTK